MATSDTTPRVSILFHCVLFPNSCPPPKRLQRPTAQGQCHGSFVGSAQLFLYWSGSERSAKSVRQELEMEASKEEQRGVIRFLVADGAAMRHKVKTP